MHAIKESLHKIQTCLVICVTVCDLHLCSFVVFQADDAQIRMCCESQNPTHVNGPLSYPRFMQLANRQEMMNDVVT